MAAEPANELRSEELSLDDVFEILSNARRRFTIHYLEENDAPVDIGELSAAVAAGENGRPVDAVSSTERKRVYVALYQCHLPKMDTRNIISYEKPRGTIEPGPNLDHVLACLKKIESPKTESGGTHDGLATATTYGKFGLAGIVLLAISYIGVADIAPVEAAGVAVLSALVTGLALYFWCSSRGEIQHRERTIEDEEAFRRVVDSPDD